MVETDWREILSFSQRELMQADKEKLCESLSWMEADDIELNFTDLKTLFRLAQDILKYKSEQVNNLLGQLETSQKKTGKVKSKNRYMDSPTRSNDSVVDTIAHQEEVIKANKEILEQLYADIAQLEGRKNKLDEDRNNVDRDSESSRDALSEMDALAQLENEVTLKNRHIRKLLGDVKILEDQNIKLKEKVSVLKEKLTEATQLIENLTEQLFSMNNESTQLKEILAMSEQTKAHLSVEMETLRKELIQKESNRENIYEEIKSKVQYWKNMAKSKKADIESLSAENTKLKEDLIRASQHSSPPKAQKKQVEDLKIQELQDKLSEASNKIMESANLIDRLKAENRQLKSFIEETPEHSVSDLKNESDDGKERTIINKLKKKNKALTVSYKEAERMIADREEQLTEIAAQLQLMKNDEGICTLIDGLKQKKQQLKCKDERIKSLVQELNAFNEIVNDLQLENETMREKLNIPPNDKISPKGIMKKYRDIEQVNIHRAKELMKTENRLVTVELQNRSMNLKINKMRRILFKMGCSPDKIAEICHSSDSDDDVMPTDGGGESSTILTKKASRNEEVIIDKELEMQRILDENEGLRKGLQEILDFLKDNSTTTSGILALKCPSLEAILQAMEARHAAGWFAPHMAAIMELRAVMGGKDALLTALHEARKETFEVMTKLSQQSQKSIELEHKISEIESKQQIKESEQDQILLNFPIKALGEFGTWMSDKEQISVDLNDKRQIENILTKGNLLYEDKLRNGLLYFHNKFKTLHEKMTAIALQSSDDQNRRSIQEEQYKAQIENLKAMSIQNDDEDFSDASPGLVNQPSMSSLQRKCSYLEESYKYIRTLNENMKNEYLESKRDALHLESNYEIRIQKLILSVANLTDKLRNSISVELFWKQNEALNELTTKYRTTIDKTMKKQGISNDLLTHLESDKIEIIGSCQKEILGQESNEYDQNLKTVLSNVEQTIFSKQLQQVCAELEDKYKQIENLETKNVELQNTQSKLIDETLGSITKKDSDLMKEQLEILVEDNKTLKQQCQHVENQLDIALLQLQDSQQRQLSNDMEINMLRHQILDLQSSSDNKAIVARLSGEVLVAHLQASESFKKIERLNSALSKEKQLRFEAEEMLKARQKIFDVYAFRFQSKFRYMYEVMQVLRQQYQGSLPLTSIEGYLNCVEDLFRKSHDVNEKLNEIEDLRSSLMAKHSVFDQILDISKAKCLEDEDSCPHKLHNIVTQGIHSRELNHCKKKLETLEQSREELLKRCNFLDKTLVLVNQGFQKTSIDENIQKKNSLLEDDHINMELVDIHSDDETSDKKNQTITLPKPQVLKPTKHNIDMTKTRKEDTTANLLEPPINHSPINKKPDMVSVFVQTCSIEVRKTYKIVQTDEDKELCELKQIINSLNEDIKKKEHELTELVRLKHKQNEELQTSKAELSNLQSIIQTLNETNHQKDNLNENLWKTVEALEKEIDDKRNELMAERMKDQRITNEKKKNLLIALKQFENDKKSIIEEYKDLLNKEREEYTKSVKQLNMKITELQSQIDRKGCDNENNAPKDTLKEILSKYTLKIADLEDKCFNSQSELDGCKAELKTYQSEVDRWKDLATERLSKMEQLNSQIEERHCHEVESYKAENDHWLSQLNLTQREHKELRSRLSEQKAVFVKQLCEKDAHIEQLRSMVHGLKTQIMNMQTMISISDPSFDLSAIVEVEETSDESHVSDRLELKFDSSVDLHDGHDDVMRMSATSPAIWQEPLIERLRKEKQLTSKQNALLRRQIKALAARERRSRLDAQNLKNQVFRISTSGSKAATAESTSLHNKIATLQAQLMSARRDTSSSVALWDKWKRSQQASERWQTRYEEKCQETKKLEAQLSLAKSAVSRLEKEKRVLLSRLSEAQDQNIHVIEKQDAERTEKSGVTSASDWYEAAPAPVSELALLERVRAQQRRIAALEVAEKGNEHLVSEYEKSLAEVTSLKGQVLKLESTLLESQIRSPLKASQDKQPEVDYWKNYCEMLKEENVQLTLKVNSLEITPTTSHSHRVNDLEQTVLTLRGLVSKLQAEQKNAGTFKRPESRPSSGRSTTDKGRKEAESYRIEIANLKRSILDKDLLLERSKEMLKIAAEREDDLLRENTDLRRRLDELTKHREGCLSV